MKTIKVNLNGVEMTLTLNESGQAHICSHWELIDVLADMGLLIRIGNKSDFHHREYKLAPGFAACLEAGLNSFEITGGELSTRQPWQNETQNCLR